MSIILYQMLELQDIILRPNQNIPSPLPSLTSFGQTVLFPNEGRIYKNQDLLC